MASRSVATVASLTLSAARLSISPNAAQASGSGLIEWDGATLSDPTAIPPVADVPNRVGRNPHDDSAKRIHGRCNKALFLRPNGQITDPTALVVDQQPILVDGQLCPP